MGFETPDDIEGKDMEPEPLSVDHNPYNPSSSKYVIIGSLLVFVSQWCWGTMEALIKLCDLPESQILISRYLIQLIYAVIWWNLGIGRNKTIRWYGDNKRYIINIWLRGFLYFLCLLFGYYGLLRIPVGDELAIFCQAPLWTVILAWLHLKESLPTLCIFIPSLFLTGVGIVILSQPSFIFNVLPNDDYESLDVIGICMVSASMFCWALCNVLVRKAVQSHWLQLELSTSLQSVVIWIPLCALLNALFIHDEYFNGDGWLFDIYSVLYMMGIGGLGFFAMALLVIGVQYGEATKIAWLENVELFVAMLYQAFLFNDPPNLYETLGTAMVVIGSVLPLSEELYKYYVVQKHEYHQVRMDTSNTEESE
eukprot:224084_1